MRKRGDRGRLCMHLSQSEHLPGFVPSAAARALTLCCRTRGLKQEYPSIHDVVRAEAFEHHTVQRRFEEGGVQLSVHSVSSTIDIHRAIDASGLTPCFQRKRVTPCRLKASMESWRDRARVWLLQDSRQAFRGEGGKIGGVSSDSGLN